MRHAEEREPSELICKISRTIGNLRVRTESRLSPELKPTMEESTRDRGVTARLQIIARPKRDF